MALPGPGSPLDINNIYEEWYKLSKPPGLDIDLDNMGVLYGVSSANNLVGMDEFYSKRVVKSFIYGFESPSGNYYTNSVSNINGEITPQTRYTWTTDVSMPGFISGMSATCDAEYSFSGVFNQYSGETFYIRLQYTFISSPSPGDWNNLRVFSTTTDGPFIDLGTSPTITIDSLSKAENFKIRFEVTAGPSNSSWNATGTGGQILKFRLKNFSIAGVNDIIWGDKNEFTIYDYSMNGTSSRPWDCSVLIED
ncbi:MAG: hypothetical protein ACOC1K_05890 [Nanoarchaeota archaeon]